VAKDRRREGSNHKGLYRYVLTKKVKHKLTPSKEAHFEVTLKWFTPTKRNEIARGNIADIQSTIVAIKNGAVSPSIARLPAFVVTVLRNYDAIG
jgi:hypothetical protein